MPRFAANLSMLFGEVEFLDRFSAAAEAGFEAVECHFPYDYPEDALAEQLEGHRLTQVLFNLPPGDWQAGERGIACHPARVGEFQDGVDRAIDYASTLGCSRVNCLAGITPPGVDADRVRDCLLANIQFAAEAFRRAGIKLLVEAINTRDMPGFNLPSARQVLDLFDAAGVENGFLQYDVYHAKATEAQRVNHEEGDDASNENVLVSTITEYLPRIAHLQIADYPGRHEPGTGEIDFPELFRLVDRLGYTGWIGCEYRPRGTTLAGLEWLRSYLKPDVVL